MPAIARRLIVIVVLVLKLAAEGEAFGHDWLCGTPADELTAERVGLIREWVIQLPFDSGGYRLEHVVVTDEMVIAQTGDGGVFAVQSGSAGPARPGTLLWSRQIGKPGGPTAPAGVGSSLVTVARDIDLYALDRSTGQTRWHDRLGRLPATGATPAGDWVYAPLDGDGVMRLPADPHRAAAEANAAAAGKQPHTTGKKPAKKDRKKPTANKKKTTKSLVPVAIDAGGRLAEQPIAFATESSEGSILWCTTAGTIVALEPNDTGWQRHEFFLDSRPAGRLAVRDNAIFATTDDNDLVRIDLTEQAGSRLRLNWHVLLDEKPDDGPLVSGDTVVVSLGDAGISAYSAETGAALWHTCVAGRILAIGGNRLWCIDRVGRLAALDLADGARREWLCLAGFSFPVVNTQTDRLVLATPGGVLVSLAPGR